MTYEELCDAMMKLTPEERKQTAKVWPPAACPTAEGVTVTELKVLPQNIQGVYILTGKQPV